MQDFLQRKYTIFLKDNKDIKINGGIYYVHGLEDSVL